MIYCKKQFKIQQRFKNVSRETMAGYPDCLKGSIELFHKMFHVKQWQDDPDCLKERIKLIHKMFHVKQWQDDPDRLKERIKLFHKMFHVKQLQDVPTV